MDKASQKLLIDMMKRGGTLLQQPCPKCGWILMRYKGVEICPVDSGIKSIEELEKETSPVSGLEDETLKVARNKLKQFTKDLKDERDPKRVGQILDNMGKLVELISRLERREPVS